MSAQCAKFGCERVFDTVSACDFGGSVKKLIGERGAAREGSFAWEWLEGQTLLLQNQTQRQGQYILQELRSRRLRPAEILESSNIRAAA